MRPRRVLVITAAPLLIAGLAVALIGCGAWGRLPSLSPPPVDHHPMLTNEQYGKFAATHPRPYIVEIIATESDPSGPAVLVYGAEHTRDPADPALDGIRRSFEGFAPTVALCESRLGVMFPMFMDPVETFGEPGLVHALAREHNIRTFTWEPDEEVVVRAILEQGFSREQTALYFALRPYFSTLRHGKPKNPEAYVRDTFSERMRLSGIDNVLASMDDLEAAWRREFPDGPDWRDVSDQYGLPGYLARIDANVVRDEHLVRCIVDLVGQSERVFVIAGSSHAVKIKPALEEVLGPTSSP